MKISVISENDIDANIFNVENDIDFLEKTKDYLPSFETKFNGTDFNEIRNIKELWHQEKMEELKKLHKVP
jgi:hypothetical protein